MQTAIQFDPLRLPPETEKLRQEVREFIAEEIENGTITPGWHVDIRPKDITQRWTRKNGKYIYLL